MLAARYVTFHKSLVSTPKLCVRLMARLFENDQRTVLGRTLHSLTGLCDVPSISLLTSSRVKAYFGVPVEEQWKIKTVTELMQIRNQSLSLPGFTAEEISVLLTSTCISSS